MWVACVEDYIEYESFQRKYSSSKENRSPYVLEIKCHQRLSDFMFETFSQHFSVGLTHHD